MIAEIVRGFFWHISDENPGGQTCKKDSIKQRIQKSFGPSIARRLTEQAVQKVQNLAAISRAISLASSTADSLSDSARRSPNPFASSFLAIQVLIHGGLRNPQQLSYRSLSQSGRRVI
jgi:hypothetical protein